MSRSIAILLLSILLFSSCASILNSQYQKVSIRTKKENTIYIDGEEVKREGGYYLIKRDYYGKQITAKREGFKDENLSLGQYKRHWLYIISWVPFGVLSFIPPALDRGPKAFNYDKTLSIGRKMKAFPVKEKEDKEVFFRKIGVDLDSENNRYRYFYNYKDFKRNEKTKSSNSNSDNDKVSIENTIFSESINEILKENGYIDTTRKVLKNSYLNNVIVDADIKEYTLHHIKLFYGGFYYVDLTLDYTILDYYGDSVFTQSTEATSGQFVYTVDRSKDRREKIDDAIKDALELSMIEFFENDVVDSLMKDRSDLERENSFQTIPLAHNNRYVSSLGEAISSSVTIKTKDGHGSGFVVSSDGHLVTNYHVISDTTDLMVVLNDEREFKPEIIRVSKINDLALIKIDVDSLIPFQISKATNIEIAKDIYAVGTPSGEDLSQSITKGIISGIRKTDSGGKLIQTDASINGGNSGGVLIDKNAEVIGIVSSKLRGFSIEGVAFGIPSYVLFDKLKIDNSIF